MHAPSEAFQLAIMTASGSRLAADKRVARVLWKMASEPRRANSTMAGCLILAARLRD